MLVGIVECLLQSKAVSRQPLIGDAPVRSQVSSCDICSGQSGSETGFFLPQYFCFPLPVSFHQMPHTVLHLHAFLSRRTSGRRLGTFQKQFSYGNWGTLSRKMLSCSVCGVTLLHLVVLCVSSNSFQKQTRHCSSAA